MYNSRDFELSNQLYFGFFGRANRFSNFYQSPMIVEAEELNAFGKATDRKMNLQFQTAEAFYQWKKAMASPVENRCYRIENSPLDGVICNSIRMASTPAQAKAIGRRSVHMNLKTWSIQARISAMRDVIAAKFKQVTESDKMPSQWDQTTTYKCDRRVSLSVQLLCTGNAVLVECSPFDKLWGIGKNEHDFNYYVDKQCFITELPEKTVIDNLFEIPIPNDFVESACESIGANLLDRILMERRLELRNMYINSLPKPVVKPLSEINNKLYARRMKRKAHQVEHTPSKKICTR